MPGPRLWVLRKVRDGHGVQGVVGCGLATVDRALKGNGERGDRMSRKVVSGAT